MHIINDFFLLTWNQKESSSVVFEEEVTLRLSHNYTHDAERFCDSVAITLIIHPENLEAIGKLESSKQILNNLFSTLPFTKENIQKAQKTVLHFLSEQGNIAINQSITRRLERLRKEEIISYDIARRLMSFLSLIEEKKEVIHPKSEAVQESMPQSLDYHEAVNALVAVAQKLTALLKDENLEKRVSTAIERMRNATFSIGVTGVMNAGKSTMLNALLGKELLGTAVVPETANLTVIGFNKASYAQVHFWTEAQWNTIERSASSLGSIEAFVQETKHCFGESFKEWITQEGKSERISLEELGNYTSAKVSDKKCNLVKSVELYTDLDLLKDGVVIVDTPGLDDPVVQREEITLSYLNECDVLIHLMNAAQAATQKDVDFIIDALLYRKVAQLLIVITRIDAISGAELEEVIAYTKQSIHRRLEEHNKGSLLDEIIAKLHFMPIAGKLALWHKIGRADEALALGYSLEKTGMPQFEHYLRALLFGEESAKAKITLSSNRKELQHVAFTCKESLTNTLSLLLLSKEEISTKYETYRVEKNEIEASLERFLQAVDTMQEEIKHYFKTLHLFADNKADALGRLLYRRIMDDVQYELSKYKRLPKEERIGYMLDIGLKEGMLDLVRDYRYEFQKKMERSLEQLSVYYKAFSSQVKQEPFDAKAFCDEQFSKTMIFKNSAVVVSLVNRAIASDAKKENGLLDKKIEAIVSEEIKSLKEMLWQTLSALNEALLEEFISHVHTPALSLQEQMQREEKTLREALERLVQHSEDEGKQKQDLEERLRSIEEVLEALHVRSEA